MDLGDAKLEGFLFDLEIDELKQHHWVKTESNRHSIYPCVLLWIFEHICSQPSLPEPWFPWPFNLPQPSGVTMQFIYVFPQ